LKMRGIGLAYRNPFIHLSEFDFCPTACLPSPKIERIIEPT
jgi:hypothetical protein